MCKIVTVYKVITTVGRSLIANYLDCHDEPVLRNRFDRLERSRYEEQSAVSAVTDVKNKILSWAEKNQDASAEIKSLVRIQEYLGQQLDVYLLASDTMESPLAAEIIKEYLTKNHNFKVYFNPDIDVIRGLQIYDFRDLQMSGLPNLVRRINGIAKSYFDNVVFNISGGYKGVITYITLMGFVNNCDIFYIFEDSKELIRIPRFPIKIDNDIFERNHSVVDQLRDTVDKYSQYKEFHYQACEDLEQRGLIERADDIACLSPLGMIFYNSFISEYFVFYCSEEVWKEIEQQEDIRRILATKFVDDKLRYNKNELKCEHLVYDDGDNQNRIYYFVDQEKIYIYKTFQNEESAQKYIKKPLDKRAVINRSKIRKIKRQVLTGV